MEELAFIDVGKTYPNGVMAVRDVNLTIADGELVVLVGPSGCGKSTLLRMVAGLEDVTTGEIRLDGRVINDVREADRDVAMVFQSYALYPHLSVKGNIAFPLKIARVSREERERRVRAVASIVGLANLLDTKPAQLSGGQRQRVAMARAIVREPRAFLMDEPLSNLDAKLRVEMRHQILELQRRLGTTMIYVTHDQAEALTLGDRVVVLRDGEVQQVAAPEVMYRQPANVFVARFVGSPPMNLLLGRAEVENGVVVRVRFNEDATLELGLGERAKPPASGGPDVVVGVRPEDVGFPANGSASVARQLNGTVRLRESYGSDVYAHLRIDGSRPLPVAIGAAALEATENGEGERGGELVARLPASATVATGDQVKVQAAIGALRLFDGQTGEALEQIGSQTEVWR